MAAPLISQDDVIKQLRWMIPKEYRIEIFQDFPTDTDVVRYGIYVTDVHTIDRTPYQLGIGRGGSIYHCIDNVQVLYVSFQDDQFNSQVNELISSLPYAYKYNSTNTSQVLSVDTQPYFSDGYHECNFTQELYYGPKSEKHTWTFQFHRIETQ